LVAIVVVVRRINLYSARRRMMQLPSITVQVANHLLDSSILVIIVVFVTVIAIVFVAAVG